MPELSSSTRKNLNAQGFQWLGDEAKSRFALPLRFTPTVGTILVLLGLILQSPKVLGAVALIALSGALFPRGMVIDLAYNLAVRHLFHASRLPATPAPRRFSYLLSAALLSGSALALERGLTVLGIVLGGAVALGGAVLATTLFCLGSVFYRLLPLSKTESPTPSTSQPSLTLSPEETQPKDEHQVPCHGHGCVRLSNDAEGTHAESPLCEKRESK